MTTDSQPKFQQMNTPFASTMSDFESLSYPETAIVTGASRGIGAKVAHQLALAGADVGINYRSKEARAQEVANDVVAAGRSALLLKADITNRADVDAMFEQVKMAWRKLDILILNASGGLEHGKAEDYAMQLNLTAQVNLVTHALPLMKSGGKIVFVTSHLAHFYGVSPSCVGYEVVAASKKAGEDALRALLPDLAARGIGLVVVSGDLIEGTVTPKLLERQNRGLIEKRKQAVGRLPDVEEFAMAITRAATSDVYAHGETIYVGSISPDGL
jgi:3-oxoacyl-[acyl-carrier protein] reductase